MSVYTTSTSAVLRIADLELHIGKEALEWGAWHTCAFDRLDSTLGTERDKKWRLYPIHMANGGMVHGVGIYLPCSHHQGSGN
jgi:hypothetical protein